MNQVTADLPDSGRPSPEVADLIRAGVQFVLDAPPEWIDEINAAVVRGAGMAEIAEDETLLAIALNINAGNLAHWATRNLEDPGCRVGAATTDEAAEFVRELVRRGLDAGALDSFRTAQNVAWELWMGICFELTDDRALLRELLEVTSASIATFIDDTVHVLADQVNAARAELAGDTHAQRRVAVALLLEGAPISASRAEAQLRYRLDGPHVAMVVTGEPGTPPEDLEAVCEAIMVANGAADRLTVQAGASEVWVWMPVPRLEIGDALDAHPGVRVAVGSAGIGREGFRRGHFEALTARRLMSRLGSTRRVAHHDDLRLVALLGDDAAAADDFIASTLGDFASADEQLHECVRVWFATGCNASETAARLYTHRNTVVRRLARADTLLPVPLSGNAVHVAVALELLEWRG